MIASLYTKYKNIKWSLEILYDDMPAKDRSQYLCFITKEAMVDISAPGIMLSKKDIKLIPRHSLEMMSMTLDKGQSRPLLGNYYYAGSFNFLFTLNTECTVDEFKKWNKYRTRLGLTRFRLNLNQIKKICSRFSDYPCDVHYDPAIGCVCEKNYNLLYNKGK